MERRAKAIAGLLLAALVATSAPARAESPVATVCLAPLRYLRGRALDLLDAVELHVGAGRGVKADVKYAVHFFGFGEVRSHRFGIMDRRAGVWREIDTELCLFPVSLLGYPVGWGAKAVGARRTAWYADFIAVDGTAGLQHLDRKELNGEYGFLWKDTVSGYRHTRWGDSFPIGAEVHLYVGARAAVRPLQVVDFFTSLVGVDLDPWLTAAP